MMKFKIIANGFAMGVYEGATEVAALEAYAKAAGYASLADACEVSGDSLDNIKAVELDD